MARPRFVVSNGIREELAEHGERMLELALSVGDQRAADLFRQRLDALANGGAITGLHGYECGASDPNSGPWTLTAGNQLVAADVRVDRSDRGEKLGKTFQSDSRSTA